jgi:putative tricarboxylic transport membrane protein
MLNFDQLLAGFSVALSFQNLLAAFVGALLGTVVGVLPGLGPTATMSLLLPITLYFDPVTGLIMLCGIWYGSNYGGSTTSILVNIPGEATSVMTCIDGYQMAQKGRAGAALFAAAVGSFIAGTVGIIGLQFFAPPLAKATLAFGPPEYLSLMFLAFILLTNLTGSKPIKGIAMALIGFLLGAIGTDNVTAVNRFSLGLPELMSGIDILPIAMGVFGISEIISIAVTKYQPHKLGQIRLRDLYPNKEELRRSVKPIARGSILGFFIGLIPGPGPIISTFVSYSLEKRLAKKYKDEFGKGAIEGVAGPESANNSAVMGSLVPLLALGIPFAAPAAILLAGLKMHNIETGPTLFQNAPLIFWGAIASMYIGNVMLVILNLPLIGFFAKLATVRPAVLMPITCILCLIGVYSVRNSIFDIWIMLLAGTIGYFLRKKDYPMAPLVLGLVLGPQTETALRNSLAILNGNLGLMFTRPISAAMLSAAIAFIFFMIIKRNTVASSQLNAELKNEMN